jgi:hypothetical protein
MQTTPQSEQAEAQAMCDHVVGFYGSSLVRQSQWQSAIAWFSNRAAYFVEHNPHVQIPHPGVIGIPGYCTCCGVELPGESLREQYMTAMDHPDLKAVATMTQAQYFHDGANKPVFASTPA